MEQPSKLATTLADKIQSMSVEKGQGITVQNLSSMLDRMLNDLVPGFAASDVHKELQNMLQKLADTKEDVQELLANSDQTKNIATASSVLSIVVESTEEATNRILDATEAIQGLSAGLEGDAPQKIMEQTMEIFEACNFQDLTGQRVSKVISTLEFMEEHLHSLASLMGYDDIASGDFSSVAKTPKSIEDIKDEELMNGPQDPGGAPSQADIDALFDSLE